MQVKRYLHLPKRVLESRKFWSRLLRRCRHLNGNPDNPLKALIFDSHYDPYKGVIVYVRVIDGALSAGKKIRFMATGAEFEVIEVGAFHATYDVSWRACYWGCWLCVAGIKNVKDTRVGDTVTDAKKPACEALPGYRQNQSDGILRVYPIETQDYNDLRDALGSWN